MDADKVLRYHKGDGDNECFWELSREERSDGEWATLSVPLLPGRETKDVVHALAIVAVVLDMQGLDESMEVTP